MCGARPSFGSRTTRRVRSPTSQGSRRTFKKRLGQRAFSARLRRPLVQHRDGVVHAVARCVPQLFSCHNTQAITEKGIPTDRDRQGIRLIEPKQLNVSHVFSQFVMDEVNGTK
jgi:hypothetical protein